MSFDDELGQEIKRALENKENDIRLSQNAKEKLVNSLAGKPHKKRIAVIFGGCSPEYDVSLQSASAVIKNIDQEKYKTILIGISRKGEWFLYEGEVDRIADDTWGQSDCTSVVVLPDTGKKAIMIFGEDEEEEIQIDAALPILHGKNGEDGTVQGLLELAGIPLIGCGTLSSALCMDKDRAHRLVCQAGIRTPDSYIVTKNEPLQETMNKAKCIGFPVFVKPVRAGSSFGITMVTKEEELGAAIENALEFDDQVIIEEKIEGFEVGCAVMGNEELIAGAVDEVELSKGFFDYEEKYTFKTSKIHVPARIKKETALRIQNVAKQIYRILGCSVFARVDMFLTPSEEIVFNEVNTVPGFTEHSRFPSMMKEVGMTMKEVIDYMIGQVL